MQRRGTRRTKQPDVAPPKLVCPECDGDLDYLESVVSGTAILEQWDQLRCGSCFEQFEYRHRTKRLRRVPLAKL
jgi:hypothetical protein